MVRPKDRGEAGRLQTQIDSLLKSRELLGLDEESTPVLVEQIIESQRRNRYFEYLRGAQLSTRPTDPNDEVFDPLRAAVVFHRNEQVDEAFWMIFLYTHFGKHRRSGFGYARDVYGKLYDGSRWTWNEVRNRLDEFRQWLSDHKDEIRQRNKPGGFGNHRKYESLDGWSYSGTGSVVESYVDWVGDSGHTRRIESIVGASGSDDGFSALYSSLDTVHRFGRTARFDYLMTLHKIGLIDSAPTHAHLRGATGPARGVRLLVTGRRDGSMTPLEQDRAVEQLEESIHVGYDVIEDALCNWQKSPKSFSPFRG